MSELTQNLADIIQDRAPGTTDTVFNLSTGLTFLAEVDGQLKPLELPPQFMDDPRKKVMFHVTALSEAKRITVGDIVNFSYNGNPVTFQIIYGYGSGASLQSEFLAAEKVPNLDQ